MQEHALFIEEEKGDWRYADFKPQQRQFADRTARFWVVLRQPLIGWMMHSIYLLGA